MRKTILLIMLLLAACASQPQAIQAKVKPADIGVFATLAESGTFEMELAPVYTQLAAARHSAAAQLRDGRISLADAVKVQQLADAARTALDGAYAADKRGQRNLAAALVMQANLTLSKAQGVLK